MEFILIIGFVIGIFVIAMKLGVRDEKQKDEIEEQNEDTYKVENHLQNNIIEKYDISPNVTVEWSYSVKNIEVKQKSDSPLQPFSADAWDGYQSPSGGYVNFGTYQVTGINPKTNRKNKRKFEVLDEEKAIQMMIESGFGPPFDVSILPSREPTEAQIDYALDLGIAVPEDACFLDVSALISRVTDDDEEVASEALAAKAHEYGLKFSRYHGRATILRLASDLTYKQRRELDKL